MTKLLPQGDSDSQFRVMSTSRVLGRKSRKVSCKTKTRALAAVQRSAKVGGHWLTGRNMCLGGGGICALGREGGFWRIWVFLCFSFHCYVGDLVSSTVEVAIEHDPCKLSPCKDNHT